MDYWQAVLQEVLNKKDPNYPCYFTNVRLKREENSSNCVPRPRRFEPQHQRRFYVAEIDHEAVYFTYRESECLSYILKSYSIRQTADVMGLSPRTIEFYLKNMRVKLGLNSKTDLLEKANELKLRQKLGFHQDG